MPVAIKSSRMEYKDDNGNYIGVDAVSERTTAEQVAEIEAAGDAKVQLIQDKADAVTAQLANAAEVRNMLAGVFDPNTAYVAGQYVIQTVSSVNKLFRFIADHPAGSWIGTDAVEVKLANDVTDLKSALNKLIFEETLTVTRQGQSLQTHNFVTNGVKYKIKNDTNGIINCALYDQSFQTVLLSIGTVASGAEKTYTASGNAYWLLVYASTSSSGTVTVSDLSKSVSELESSVSELESSVSELESSVSDIDEIRAKANLVDKSYVCPGVSGKSYWLHFPVESGHTYRVINNTDKNVSCATYAENESTNYQSFGAVAPGQTAEFLANHDAYYFLVYCATGSSTGEATVLDADLLKPQVDALVSNNNVLEKKSTYYVTYQAQQFWITDYIELDKKMRITNNTNGRLNCALYKQDQSTSTKSIGTVESGQSVEYTNTSQETYYLLVYAQTASSGSFIVEDRSKKIAEMEDDIASLEAAVDNTIYAYLPDDIYCANGRSIEIYNDLVCLNSEKYHIRWICNIGHAITGKFTVTGTSSNIGDYDLTLEVYDNSKNVLYAKTATLHIVAASVPATTLVTLGDSNSCGKFWQAEIGGLSSDNITLVGARSFHLTYEGTRKDIKVDGRGGFDTDRYLTGHAASVDYSDSGAETPHHALYDPVAEKFSWSYYVTNSLSGVSPDNVMIMLGTNEFGRNITTFLSNYKQIVDNIRADDPDITIFIAPCIFSGTQDGIGYQGNIEGYSQLRGAWQYNQDMAVWKQGKGLHETFASYENLYFIETAITMDRWHDYTTEEVFVNPRSAEKVSIQKESIHPTKVGYGQMADIIYSTLCGVLSD